MQKPRGKRKPQDKRTRELTPLIRKKLETHDHFLKIRSINQGNYELWVICDRKTAQRIAFILTQDSIESRDVQDRIASFLQDAARRFAIDAIVHEIIESIFRLFD